MSANKLQSALQKMPETGESGFEGLIKRLLELVLDETFLLARGGDQPSGDAHNSRRNVCVQAKRYNKAQLNAKNIEGDFDANLRALPNTDIYVLAVTRDTAQIDDTVDAMREKSGVDVVVWNFGANKSILTELCIEYWPELMDFRAIKSLDANLNAWAADSRKEPAHKERIDKIRAELRQCTQTFERVRKAALAYLRRRFQISDGETSIPLQPIRLATAIGRQKYRNQATDWWSVNKARALVINAPEGYGKTWLAAQFAWDLGEERQCIIFWLDSIQWRHCPRIDFVLSEAVSCLVGDDQRKGRLVRKIEERWSDRTLIVLDGVSERDALQAAQNILRNLAQNPKCKCRFIFTTRPIENASAYDALAWRNSLQCKVESFDDAELNTALARAQISAEELTDHLRPIARIPRYFATCLRLRKQLRRFENISVALVIWMDLLDKINGLEPDIRKNLGLTTETDAIDILVKLATTLPEATASGKAQDLLNQCFGGKYSDARHYLTEIHILEKAGLFEAKLNRSHTTLGLALLLQQILKVQPKSSPRDLADHLLEKLEPLAGEDGSAEALFVALQLGAIQLTQLDSNGSRQRAALLLAWIFSHNSNVSDERLEFWCSFDTEAYALFFGDLL